jgi:hypothetical protein
MSDVIITLVLACSRIALSSGVISIIRDCASQVSNWHYVLQIASLNGIVPLLYTHLKKICPDLIPNDIMNQLNGMYVTNSKKNLAGSATLLTILTAFSKNDIIAVPFKGPVIAERVYGSVSLRQFSDLDILIKKRDTLKACNLLAENGYEAEVMLYGKKGEEYLEFENSISFFCNRGRPSIDLHWEMTGRYLLNSMDMDTLEGNLEYSGFLGQKVLSISDDLTLIYLCIHGTSHCWEKLEWLCCFAEMIRRKDKREILQIIELAGKMGCKRMLYLGFYLGYDLLDVTLPAEVLQRIVNDKRVVSYGKKAKKIIFDQKSSSLKHAEWRFSPLHIQIRDSYLDRVRYAIYLYTAPTIKEWTKFPLPSWLTPLYRIIRPLRLGITFIFGNRDSLRKVKERTTSMPS